MKGHLPRFGTMFNKWIDNTRAVMLQHGSEDAAEELNITPSRIGLIVNADDWGRDQFTTDRIRDCVLFRSVTAASAMVFMEDSERAASLAQDCGVDVGLHLNFTTEFSSPRMHTPLVEHQQKVAGCLRAHRYAPLVFHPLLQRSFEYLVKAQIDEFTRLYKEPPDRIDGHHHMHLCTNLLFSGDLFSREIRMRRNFSFRQGEKSLANRLYRRLVDSHLARRYRMTDYLFSIMPMHPERLDIIFAMAGSSIVELETHPVNAEEFRLLTSVEFARKTADILLRPGLTERRRASCWAPETPAQFS